MLMLWTLQDLAYKTGHMPTILKVLATLSLNLIKHYMLRRFKLQLMFRATQHKSSLLHVSDQFDASTALPRYKMGVPESRGDEGEFALGA